MSNAWLHQGGASALKPSPLTAGEVPPPPLIPPDPPPDPLTHDHSPPSSPFSPQNYPPLGTSVPKQSTYRKRSVTPVSKTAEIDHQLPTTVSSTTVPIGTIQCAVFCPNLNCSFLSKTHLKPF
ncbi:unnamed protein product [Eruca vesicaria subsp. sativa]|uniref:Uncharacterized protein n=1 Tax=Eruca vesicaria subsp. sativa TaxID=29727 RepID=A0ABC8J9G3_ERUVS|nr:unnamed protein product [Eruca vesicaria subsp. sativa]